MDATVPGHVTRYLRSSGVIRWDSGTVARCRLDDDTTNALVVAAILEEDTRITAAYARSFGLDRAPDLRAYLPVWELEEAEHGRILRAIVAGSGAAAPDSRPKSIPMRRRGLALLPLRVLGLSPATGFVYCTLGAAAEYLAIASYSALTARVEDRDAADMLRAITRQESHHLAFFLAAARARGETIGPVHAHLARRAITRMWEPIGISSLGRSAWRAVNGHWLDDDRFRARAARMDDVIDSIPHLAGLHLMGNFLREWDESLAAA